MVGSLKRQEGSYLAEEVMDILLDLEARTLARTGAVLPPKPAWARALLELPLNLAGYALGRALPLLPDRVLYGLHLKVYRSLTGASSTALAPGWEAALARARALHDHAAAESGAPAVLAVLSHPPVGSEVSSLNYELMARAFEAVAAARGRPARTRLVGAVDPYALDAAPYWQEFLYAGALLGHHIALDRQPGLRGRLQRVLLARARPERAVWRLVRTLSGRGEAAVMMAGGVEPAARVLYTARELLRRWRPGRALPASERRRLEFAALSALAAGESPAAETGSLTAEARGALEALARARGLSPERAAAELSDFEAELRRALPYRRRLFESVLRRVLRSGAALLLLPLSHGRGGKVEISLGEPLLLRGRPKGPAVYKVLSPGPQGYVQRDATAGDLAVAWVGSNFD